jgi:hypothetical protein
VCPDKSRSVPTSDQSPVTVLLNSIVRIIKTLLPILSKFMWVIIRNVCQVEQFISQLGAVIVSLTTFAHMLVVIYLAINKKWQWSNRYICQVDSWSCEKHNRHHHTNRWRLLPTSIIISQSCMHRDRHTGKESLKNIKT